MNYTAFGEEMRILRVRRHQTMKDMADVLGVTKSCLSGVEKGKRAVPGKWLDILVDHYHLKEYDRSRIQDAIYESRSQIRILLNGKENYKRNLALRFEEAFDSIDEDVAAQILSVLKRGEQGQA
ncbi:MAG: helix-turn-helix domain-containing protein [Erysipelotrichaceae bacterium]|nr:helix-turn-helix domain-containing protein [Erysipelotrichaceae bacterium]